MFGKVRAYLLDEEIHWPQERVTRPSADHPWQSLYPFLASPYPYQAAAQTSAARDF